MRISRAALLPILFGGVLCGGVPSILKRVQGTKFLLYVGSNAAGSKGISAFRFDAADATAEPLGVVAEIPSPSFLAIHPQNRLLYAVSEVKEGALSGFAVNPKSGALRLVNRVPSLGEGPCHVMVDSNGWMIVVTNCASGSIASFRVGGDGGILESPSQVTNSDPKAKTNPRQMAMSPDHFFLFGPDFGLDKIFFYRFDPARVIFWPNTPPSLALTTGSGPRYLAFRPDGRFAYAVDENTSRITPLRYDKITGTVAAAGESASTLTGGFSGKNTAEDLAVDPAGKFLYASNRGDDSIAVFSINTKSGGVARTQRMPSGGKAPGQIKIDPTGRFLLAANRDSGTIVIFQIDRKTGALSATGKSLEAPSPSCLLFVPVE